MLDFYEGKHFVINDKIKMTPCPAGNTEALVGAYECFRRNGITQEFNGIRILSSGDYSQKAVHHGAVHIGFDDVRGLEEHGVVADQVVEQAEVALEDAADGEQEHDQAPGTCVAVALFPVRQQHYWPMDRWHRPPLPPPAWACCVSLFS